MSNAMFVLIASNIPIILAAILVVLRYSSYPKELRFFSGFLVVSAIAQLVSGILFFNVINNMFVLHVYTAVGGILLLLFYRELYKELISNHVLNIASAVYIILVIINSVFLQDISTFNSNALTLEAALMTILSLVYFNFTLGSNDKRFHTAGKHQWINSGIFIYFSSNLLLYYSTDYILEEVLEGVPFLNVWTLYSLPIFAAYTCYFIGLWKIMKRSK